MSPGPYEQTFDRFSRLLPEKLPERQTEKLGPAGGGEVSSTPTSLPATLALAASLAVVAHLGGGAQWVLSSLGLQRLAPDHVRGRILSMDLGLVSLTIGVSSLVAGRLADIYPPRMVMAGLAGVEVIYALAWTIANHHIRRTADGPDLVTTSPPVPREKPAPGCSTTSGTAGPS